MSDLSNKTPQIGSETLVKIENLKKWYPVQKSFLDQVLAGRKDFVRAVDGVSFEIKRGEVFGLAGETLRHA